MNDIMKQLAEEAGFLLWEDEPWKPEGAIIDWSSNYDDVLEKYTELIVRESAEMLACEYGQSATSGNEAAIFLRNHFGVKE